MNMLGIHSSLYLIVVPQTISKDQISLKLVYFSPCIYIIEWQGPYNGVDLDTINDSLPFTLTLLLIHKMMTFLGMPLSLDYNDYKWQTKEKISFHYFRYSWK